MKKALIIASIPFMVISSLAVISLIALIKAVEEAHDDDMFWE
jgi:hypothetical protein